VNTLLTVNRLTLPWPSEVPGIKLYPLPGTLLPSFAVAAAWSLWHFPGPTSLLQALHLLFLIIYLTPSVLGWWLTDTKQVTKNISHLIRGNVTDHL